MPLLRGSLWLTATKHETLATLDENTTINHAPAPHQAADIDLNNILKLVPAELVAPFIIGSDKVIQKYGHLGLSIWCILCLLCCMILRGQATRPSSSGRKWYQDFNWSVVIVSGIAFLIWAHAVSMSPPLFPFLDQTLAGLVALLFGIVAPRFVSAAVIR
jgi:hypothetical protein